ncbi:MAG: hypothetical protein LBQ54_11975 [Planctomycetaceae bacterium]|nr:hypothetical protein [Planctomycetaceae bacterium]
MMRRKRRDAMNLLTVSLPKFLPDAFSHVGWNLMVSLCAGPAAVAAGGGGQKVDLFED